jgi:excisionase family DNA binding protein
MQDYAPQTHALALSIRQVCALTGLGRTTVFAAIRTKRLVARKCGRRTVILVADLNTFLRNLPTAPEDGACRNEKIRSDQ